ncbi:MAG: hypothetical protein JW827_05620 [Spirochaetes bacterium]|nr:hypothetical protein [Spirochaetota bacterium]
MNRKYDQGEQIYVFFYKKNIKKNVYLQNNILSPSVPGFAEMEKTGDGPFTP